MFIIGLNDINKVCRICFNAKVTSIHMFLSKEWQELCAADLLFMCMGIKVDENEHLPNSICDNCIEEIWKMYEFRLKLEKSSKFWDKYIDNLVKDSIKKEDFLVIKQEIDNASSENSVMEFCTDINRGNNMLVEDAAEDQIKQVQQYTCQQCETAFCSRAKLGKHKRIFSHYKGKTIPCQVCNLLVPISNYKVHLSKHQANYTCKICNTKLCSNFNLKRHMLIHTKKFVSCHICNSKFSRVDNLKCHMLLHINNGIFSCQYCHRNFREHEKLKCHLNNCLMKSSNLHFSKYERAFSCEVCKQKFTLITSLRTHMLLHTDKCQLCSECGKPFANKSKLKLHVLNVHNTKYKEIKEFLCNVCAKQYRTKFALKQHIEGIHLGHKKLACKICSKCFGNSQSLQLHYMTHTNDKPFTCNICSKTFNRAYTLQRHMLIHTNERPYKCSFCDKKFNAKHTMIVHTRTHTGDKPYSCPDCFKRFADICRANKHRKIHLN